MTRENYEDLVRALEAKCRESPEKYKFSVRLFSALGYAYFAGVLLLSLLLLVPGVTPGGRSLERDAQSTIFFLNPQLRT